ncbi:MAG: tetratricopeptide repeat protein [Deltaproteobacteria bacterium]|nr:tetratricopeptide repeat protein [Deltaproteobacteria bacterium]
MRKNIFYRGFGFFLLLFSGVSLLLSCGAARIQEPHPSVASDAEIKAPPAKIPAFSPAASYYFSVYNWLRYQDDREARIAALQSLEKAVKADPDSVYLRLELAELLLKANKLDEARAQAEAVLDLLPGNSRARRLLAGIFTMSGNPAAAIVQYESLVAEDPENSEALYYLVALYVETLEYEKALQHLQDYRKLRPDDVLAPFYLGKVYAELKLYKEAEKYYNEALALDPEMVDAWLSLAMIYEFTERREDAVRAYRKLLEFDEDNRQALERLGQLLVGNGELDAALEIFQHLKTQGQVPVSIDVKIALIYFQQGKYQEAAALLAKLHTQYSGQQRITFYLASSLEALDRQDEALALFLSIPESDELYYDARIHVAFLYEAREEFQACENILREMIVSYPDKVGLYRMLSSLRRKQDDTQGALQILQDALVQHPDDYKLRFALGVVYNDLGRVAESVSVMQALLKENPDDAAVLNFIGYTYVEQGVQLDDAEKLLKRALELDPKSGYILDSMGWLCFARGEYHKALDYLQQARAVEGDDPVIYDHLGDIYVQLNNFTEAEQSYRRSLELKDDAKVKGKLEKLLQKKN